jgi:hypothetical protein
MSNDNSDWAERTNRRISEELAAISETVEIERIEALEAGAGENDFAAHANAKIARAVLESQQAERDLRERAKMEADAEAMRRLETIEAERDELLRRFQK